MKNKHTKLCQIHAMFGCFSPTAFKLDHTADNGVLSFLNMQTDQSKCNILIGYVLMEFKFKTLASSCSSLLDVIAITKILMLAECNDPNSPPLNITMLKHFDAKFLAVVSLITALTKF